MSKNLEQRVVELEKEVAVLKSEKIKSLLKGLKLGDTFELGGIEWRILDITNNGYVCQTTECWKESVQFDSCCNNWKSSTLRNMLNTEFYNMVAAEIGADNIIEFERDLLSLDGQTEYGKCKDKVSIISVDEYRKYRKLIQNSDKWFWTLTPDSTSCNDDSRWLAVVSPFGNVGNGICNDFGGVRPLCIFSSAIFESGF